MAESSAPVTKQVVSRPQGGGFGAANRNNNNNSDNHPKTERSDLHLQKYLQRTVCVSVNDGRFFIGRFVAFDPHMNIVLVDAAEYAAGTDSSKALIGKVTEGRREIGLIVVRGEHVSGVMSKKKKAGAAAAAVNVPTGASAVPGGQLARSVELPKAGGARRVRGDDDDE